MPEVDDLRELTGQFQRPAFDDLVAVSRTRRRRTGLAAALAVSSAVAAVAVVTAALPDGQRAVEPANPSPTGTPSPSTSTEWTPERFRDEGSAEVLIPATESGLTATQYLACSGTCSGELSNRALEVSQDGQSALFEVRGLVVSWSPVWVDVYDEDSVLVQDAAEEGRTEEPARFRLLQADGTAVELRMVDEPAPAAPGPGVSVIDPYFAWSRGMSGPDDREKLYLVDGGAGTLQPLDVPEEVVAWGPNVEEFLWGADGCRAIWQQPDGSFDFHDIDCVDPVVTSVPTDYWDYLDDWAAPGRMVLLEHDYDWIPLAVNASVDFGATWTRVEIEDRPWDGTIAQAGAAIAFALEPLE